jgi:hypothetical protein
LKLHFHHFSAIKSQKESDNSRNQGFSYDFCMILEGSGSGAGSGSYPYSDKWNLIRIRDAQKHVDPVDPDSDPDPQHCLWLILPVLRIPD